MNYTQAVEQAAAALVRGEDANWELARLTWENTLSAGDRSGQPNRASMAQWCADVRNAAPMRKFSEANGALYKAVWARYGQEDLLDRPTWTEAVYAVKPGASYEASAERRDAARTLASIEASTPEAKRAYATKLLSDPEVADAVIEQPAVRRAVYESLNRQEQRAEVRHNEIVASSPERQRLDRESALIDLERILRRFAEDVRSLVSAVGTLPERADGAVAPHLFLRQSFVAAEDALGSVRTLLNTGRSDIDNFLAEVLKGEKETW